MTFKNVEEMGKASQILFDHNIPRSLTSKKVVVSKRYYEEVVELLSDFDIDIEVKD